MFLYSLKDDVDQSLGRRWRIGEKVINSCSLLYPLFQVCLLQFIVTLVKSLSGKLFRLCSRKNDKFKVLLSAKSMKGFKYLIELLAAYVDVVYIMQINDATTGLSGTIA